MLYQVRFGQHKLKLDYQSSLKWFMNEQRYPWMNDGLHGWTTADINSCAQTVQIGRERRRGIKVNGSEHERKFVGSKKSSHFFFFFFFCFFLVFFEQCLPDCWCYGTKCEGWDYTADPHPLVTYTLWRCFLQSLDQHRSHLTNFQDLLTKGYVYDSKRCLRLCQVV